MRDFEPTRRCIKCGHSDVTVDHETRYGYNRLHRVCQRCGAGWDETPIDYDKTAEKEAISNYWEIYTRISGALLENK